jgi:hypothetical protein
VPIKSAVLMFASVSIAAFLLLLPSFIGLHALAFSPEDDPSALSIVILHVSLIQNSAADGGGNLHVKWVITSDDVDDRVGIAPSIISCPKFHWDDTALSGPDSFPHLHCGSMFGTLLPLPAAMIAPGLHTLQLVLVEPVTLVLRKDTISINVTFSSSSSTLAAASNLLMPGGNFPLALST